MQKKVNVTRFSSFTLYVNLLIVNLIVNLID